MILRTNEDVLIVFYTPDVVRPCWNEANMLQTEGLVPNTVLKTLKERYDESIIIAKCDTAMYRVPVEVYHVPTVKLYPAGKKDLPVEYFGDKTDPDAYVDFIQSEGSEGLKAKGRTRNS